MNQRTAGIALSYATLGVQVVVMLAYTPFVLRILGQEEFGLYQLVQSVIAALGMLSLGFSGAYVRFFTRFSVAGDREGMASLNGMFMTVFLCMGAVALAVGACNVIYFLMQVLTPVIFIVDLLSHGIMKLLHIDPNKKASTMTESELKTYVDVSHEDGVIESEERKLIYNVFDFSDAHAKDIMIPRINMVTVSLDATYDDVLAVFRDSMYTRLPVYEDDKDNIIGLINIKDFILTEDQSAFHVGNILRDAYYTYEYKKIADLMYEMREKTTNVSFVLNEYGATVGMITLEDLLEEIVGEIRDEYDEDEEELIQKMSEDTYLVEGSMKLDDINDVLGTNLTSEDYDSIGGLIIDCLDRLPEDGEEVTLENGIHLKVQGIDQNRIIKVLMTIPEPNEEHVEHSSETSENHE